MADGAVVTLVVGAKAEAVFRLTRPFMESWARRIGAAFVVLDASVRPDVPHLGKAGLIEPLERFDRVVYIDCDALVHPDCPDLMEIVPADRLGALVESALAPRGSWVRGISRLLGPVDWSGDTYFNSGVMVLSRVHRGLFVRLLEVFDTAGGDYEQGHLNWLVQTMGLPIEPLDARFNHMGVSGRPTTASMIVHFAGIGFEPVASAAADVWSAKYHDMLEFVAAFEGRTCRVFDAERLDLVTGAVNRFPDRFSVTTAPVVGEVFARSPRFVLPRGRYEISLSGPAAEGIEARVFDLLGNTRLPMSADGRFDVVTPHAVTSVELVAVAEGAELENLIVERIDASAWGRGGGSAQGPSAAE